MPAVKWTSERNERLLLLVIKDVKLDYAKLAKAWEDRYGDLDDFKPTPRAITEQYKALCKRAGVKESSGGASGEKATPKSTPVKPKAMTTPTKNASVKTPTSNKRKVKSMSDDDDSEDEKATARDDENVAPRAKSQRRSKTPKSYCEDALEATIKREGGLFDDDDMGSESVAENGNGVDFEAMSDFSNFEPSL